MTKQEKHSAAMIERAIRADDWHRARTLIRAQLRQKPDDHWLLTRLSVTYYEQKQYRKSLYYVTKALQIAPYCPLAVWDYAGTLDVLERRKKALSVYQWLISWGEEAIAYGDCGEGLRFARSLIADSYYRIAHIYSRMHQKRNAIRAYKQHFTRRKRGTRSIYPLAKVRREYQAVAM